MRAEIGFGVRVGVMVSCRRAISARQPLLRMSWISYVLNSGSADTPALANVGFLVFRFLKTENPEKSNLVFIVFLILAF